MNNNGCGQLGAIQTRGTCWFFSILNGFILSEAGQKILYVRLKDYYKKLKPDQRAYFDDKFNAPCPMKDLTKTKEIYFWKFIDQYLCYMSGPRSISLKAGKSANILEHMNLQGTVAKQGGGGKGAHPQQEIEKILEHVGFKGKFDTRYANRSRKFDGRKNPQFVIVMENDVVKQINMPEIPLDFMDDPKYSIMCASIIIANTKANNSEMHKYHALAGYMCNGKGYIYDSNQKKVFKCDWWDVIKLQRVVGTEVAQFYSFFKGGQINYYAYAYAIFSNNEFTKDVAPSCLMKYKTKTPPAPGYNFTDPRLGSIINRRNNLKPANRVALKRKWARTQHKEHQYVNSTTLNSIINGATTRSGALQGAWNLRNAGYTIKNDVYSNFEKKLNVKFPVKQHGTYTFAEAKTYLNQYKQPAVRKYKYGLVWKGIPMPQRKVLMHYRNTGIWLANNAFEKGKTPSPPIKKETPSPVKVKTPSPSPRTKRAIGVKANFEQYWKAIQPENRQMIRNYVKAYKSPSPPIKKETPPKPKNKSPSPPVKKESPNKAGPSNQPLRNARNAVNALKTAVARKAYLRQRAANLSDEHWKLLGQYIRRKNFEAQKARENKKALKK